MTKHKVTVSHFNPVQAAAAKNKAVELAAGDEGRVVMIRPDFYVIMNSVAHANASHKIIKRIRKEHGLA